MAHLELLLTGITVVMVVLVALWGACVIMGVAFRARKPPSTDAGTTAEEEPPLEGIPAHHIAVITGAVAKMVPGSFRILNVRAPALIATAWAESNRFAQASTHRVRWDWPLLGKSTVGASPNAAKNDSGQKD